MIAKILLRLTIYSVIIYFFLSFYFFYVYIRPRRFISKISPRDLGLAYEDISLETSDGIKLAGWFIPQKSSQKAVIVCHGYPADKGNVLGLALFLAPHYNLFLFDFRALGNSGGKFSTGGWKEKEDFLAGINFLKRKGFTDIGAFGFSMGGAVILMSNNPDIKAIVSDSSYADLSSVINLIFKNFGIFGYPFVGMFKIYAKVFFKMDIARVSPLKYITYIKAPIFLIHSEQDSQIPLEHALLLHQASPKSKLWIIQGADHGQNYASTGEEYENKVLGFFQDNLKQLEEK